MTNVERLSMVAYMNLEVKLYHAAKTQPRKRMWGRVFVAIAVGRNGIGQVSFEDPTGRDLTTIRPNEYKYSHPK